MLSQKLNRQPLADQLAQAIAEHIQTNQLGSGEFLPSTAQICELFSVSRPVVREALKILEGQGIIQISNGKSPVVKALSDDVLHTFFHRAAHDTHESTLQLLEVRRAIEIDTAALAAERITQQEQVLLQTHLQAMAASLKDAEAYAEADLEFHLLIAVATHNDMFYYLIRSIRHALKDSILKGLKSRRDDQEIRKVQQVHEAIFTAIAAHDSTTARQAMATHFDEAITILMERVVPQRDAKLKETIKNWGLS